MKFLKGKRVLVTAGPTREYIDPVRYISNDSTGKMGYAIATCARKAGAKVILISGPTALKCPEGVELMPVTTAAEMHKAALSKGKGADIVICAAAVADSRPAERSRHKIKRGSLKVIRLTENPDILKALGRRKRAGQYIVGFALETKNVISNAEGKLRQKNCDLIIVNKSENIGAEKGSVVVLDKSGILKKYNNLHKSALAKKIVDLIAKGGNWSDYKHYQQNNRKDNNDKHSEP